MAKGSPQKSHKNLGVLLYERSQIPKYFEVDKKIVQFLTLGIPTLALLSLAALFFGGVYFKEFKRKLANTKPEEILKLEESLNYQKERTASLMEQNNSLKAKLTSSTTLPLDDLNLFAPTVGRDDLSKNPGLSIDDIVYSFEKDKINLAFNLVNETTNGKRIYGHLFVLVQSASGILVYPPEALKESSGGQLDFSNGESFATSRFRPVNIQLPNRLGVRQATFKVIVFNRLGDLILSKIIKPVGKE